MTPLLAHLASGEHGVVWTPPDGAVIAHSGALDAQLHDPATQVLWYAFFFPALHLRLGGEGERAAFRTLAAHYARAMFDDTFRELNAGAPGDLKPRTSDPDWSPLVDFDVVDVEGGVALRLVHRMAYQPGRELIMGHVLVPLRGGLLELRVLSAGIDRTTGIREAVLMDRAMAASKAAPASIPLLPQNAYDDPKHDAAFPHHPLSLVRGSLDSIVTGKRAITIQRLAAGVIDVSREIEWPSLGCALTPPARFVIDPAVSSQSSSPRESPTFRRSSFCGTDGLETFFVDSHGACSLQGIALAQDLEHRSRALIDGSGLENVHIQVSSCSDARIAAGRTATSAVIEADGKAGKLRHVLLWHQVDGALWCFAILGGAAVPAELRIDELVATAATWRPLKRGFFARLLS